MTAFPYQTRNNNYIHIGEEPPEIETANGQTKRGADGGGRTFFHGLALIQMLFLEGVDAAELKLGDNLKYNLNLNKQTNQDITYLVRDASKPACVHIYDCFRCLLQPL